MAKIILQRGLKTLIKETKKYEILASHEVHYTKTVGITYISNVTLNIPSSFKIPFIIKAGGFLGLVITVPGQGNKAHIFTQTQLLRVLLRLASYLIVSPKV